MLLVPKGPSVPDTYSQKQPNKWLELEMLL